jgi:hypothetical protein
MPVTEVPASLHMDVAKYMAKNLLIALKHCAAKWKPAVGLNMVPGRVCAIQLDDHFQPIKDAAAVNLQVVVPAHFDLEGRLRAKFQVAPEDMQQVSGRVLHLTFTLSERDSIAFRPRLIPIGENGEAVFETTLRDLVDAPEGMEIGELIRNRAIPPVMCRLLLIPNPYSKI